MDSLLQVHFTMCHKTLLMEIEDPKSKGKPSALNCASV